VAYKARNLAFSCLEGQVFHRHDLIEGFVETTNFDQERASRSCMGRTYPDAGRMEAALADIPTFLLAPEGLRRAGAKRTLLFDRRHRLERVGMDEVDQL
jgi:hypothetical protein